MIRVTDLKRGKKNRYIVTINDKEYDVNENLVLNYHLTKNHIIEDEQELDKIISDIEYYDFYDLALTYIERNMKSSGAIIQYLKNKGASFEISTKIVNTLVSRHLLDDRKYYIMLIEHYIRQGYGPLFIINKAKLNGVPSSITNDISLDSYYKDIKENCMTQALKKKKMIKDSDNYKIKLKLSKFLSSRGYNYEMISEVLKEVL